MAMGMKCIFTLLAYMGKRKILYENTIKLNTWLPFENAEIWCYEVVYRSNNLLIHRITSFPSYKADNTQNEGQYCQPQ